MRAFRRWARTAAVLPALAAAVLAVVPAGIARADAVSADPNGHGTPTVSQPCGVDRRHTAPARYDHVIWILEENKSFENVMGSPDAPFINGLAAKCGSATAMTAESHPSLPNYVAMTSGSLQGVTDDAGPSAHPLDVPSIFSQLHGDWRGLDESMTTNCEQKNDGNYAVRHNPAAYYTNIRNVCDHRDVPLEVPLPDRLDLSAKFTFVTPDVCDDMHSTCGGSGTADELRRGDAFLSGLMAKIINSNEYQNGRTAVFLTWDEGVGAENRIATLVIAPSVPAGTTSGIPFNHYSMLRTTEDMLGLPHLGAAETATSMRGAFGL